MLASRFLSFLTEACEISGARPLLERISDLTAPQPSLILYVMARKQTKHSPKIRIPQGDNPFLEQVLQATKRIRPALDLSADAVALRRGENAAHVHHPRRR